MLYKLWWDFVNSKLCVVVLCVGSFIVNLNILEFSFVQDRLGSADKVIKCCMFST
jgi:hypothetical protein